MILIEEILILHANSIKLYGGADGVRDMELLKSSVARPFSTFDGKDLYSSAFEKASALGESIIVNHPFVDGNKRTGFLAITTFLLEHKFELIVEEEKAFQFVVSISTGSIATEDIVKWLTVNSAELI